MYEFFKGRSDFRNIDIPPEILRQIIEEPHVRLPKTDGSPYDAEDERMLDENKVYLKCLQDFTLSKPHWIEKANNADKLSLKERKSLVDSRPNSKGYEQRIISFSKRPPLEMIRMNGYDELQEWCDAITLGWKLWADCWMGLHLLIDYVAVNLWSTDIARLSHSFLHIVKEMAVRTNWPNNPVWGRLMTASAAKCVLCRVSRKCSYDEACVVKIVRSVAYMHVTDESTFTTHDVDERKICFNKRCYKIEDNVKFKICGGCKIGFSYCSKACQREHWNYEHRGMCKNLRGATRRR